MVADPLLPNPAALTLDSLCVHGGVIVFAARTVTPGAACPCCGWLSERVHSRYRRTLLDLPWQGNAVRIILNVRKFFCDNPDCQQPDCQQRVFAERLPAVAARYARKTNRLTEALRELASLAGGEAAARIARAFGLIVSPDALLEGFKKATPPSFPTVRVLGVDDFAFRRGHTYGTILVDLERRCPVDLLPDREAASVEAWLTAHPGVQVISRDRSETYRNASTQGAPDAVQVADRFHLFHLVKNSGDTLKQLLERHYHCLSKAVQSLAQQEPQDSPDSSDSSDEPSERTQVATAAPVTLPVTLRLTPSPKGEHEKSCRRHKEAGAL